MQRNNVHPSLRRALVSAAAFLVLLFAGAGVALADRSCRDDHRHGGHHRGGYYDDDGDRYREHRRHHRVDRQRYDRDHRHGSRYGDRYNYRHNQHRGYYRPSTRRFEVPRVIHRQHRSSYRTYHHGRIYHSQHRHYHEIYRFPVYGEYGVEHYPYAYCEGSFFARGVFRHGRALFDLRIDFW